MKTKRVRILTLAILISLTASLIGCGNTNTEINVEEENNEQLNIKKDTSKPDLELPDFEPVTISETNNYKLAVTDVQLDQSNNYLVNIEFSNKTESDILVASILEAYVNGVKISPIYTEQAAQGQTINKNTIFYQEDLKDISTYTDMYIHFSVFNSENRSSDSYFDEYVHIYPYGEENKREYEWEPKDTDVTILDNKDIKIIATSLADVDYNWGYSLNIYIENKTNKSIMISSIESTLNNKYKSETEPMFSVVLEPNTKTFTTMTWYNEFVEGGNMVGKEVNEITTHLQVTDLNTWDAGGILDKEITFTPPKQ